MEIRVNRHFRRAATAAIFGPCGRGRSISIGKEQ
jgi:hypothetical protein